jgi:membrane-associated phospholipid phosphatase
VIGGAGAVVLVGLSRLVTSVHFPSDVLAGWLWVAAWAAVAASWLVPDAADEPARGAA